MSKKTDEEFARQYIVKLARARLQADLFGRYPPMLHGNDIETDGRKQKRAVRVLTKLGYISEAVDADRRYVIDGTVLDHITPEKPALKEHGFDFNPDLHTVGCIWMRLPLAERLYIAQQPDSFTFRMLANNSTWNPPPLPFEYGMKPSSSDDVPYKARVVVSTPELDAAFAAFKWETRVETTMGRNLEWGLEVTGVIHSPDKNINPYASSAECGRFPGSDKVFGGDPEKWEKELSELVQHSVDRQAYHTRKLERLRTLQSEMALKGGWKKFLAAFKQKVEEELTADDAKKAAEKTEKATAA